MSPTVPRQMSAYVASDYAGIDVPLRGIKFYYGYEVTDKDDNWCFKATFPDGEVTTIPYPALQIADDKNDPFEVVGCLMTGIAILVERGDLVPSLEPTGQKSDCVSGVPKDSAASTPVTGIEVEKWHITDGETCEVRDGHGKLIPCMAWLARPIAEGYRDAHNASLERIVGERRDA